MTRRERLERKIERRQEWANKAEARSNAAFNTAHRIADAIPFGQPILVGHHSERHARRDAERIDNNMRKGCENADLAKYHESKADGLQAQLDRSIYSDDHDAIAALEQRIAEREAERERMKLVNKLYKKADIAGLKAIGIDYEQLKAKLAAAGSYWGSAPHLPYELQNLGARITADKKRLEVIKAQHDRAAKAEESPNGVTLEQCSGGYVRVTFAEKPEREILTALKTAGFWWSKGSWAGKGENLPPEVKELLAEPTKATEPQETPTEAAEPPEQPIIIKGCPSGPNGKWEEVQAIQDKPFIYIKWNGSRWLGDEEGDIEELAEMLRKHTLGDYGHYCVNPCVGVEDPERRGHYIDGPRMYRVDGVYSFSGNFLEYSHAFGIDTNHKPTIDLLVSLFEANFASEPYQRELAKRREKEQSEREAEQQTINQQDAFWMVPAE